jgi:hypothetical protein
MAICTWCNGEMAAVVSCAVKALHRDGAPIAMVPWGRELGWSARQRCHDCGVMPSGFHHLGCDTQECPLCAGQMLSCGCRFDEDGPDDQDGDGGVVVLERFLDSNGCPAERRLLAGQEVIFHYDDLPESDVTVVDGIRCTTALRTVIDIAPDVDAAQLERITRDALDRQLFTIEEAQSRMAQPDMATRPGAVLLRDLLGGWRLRSE